MQETWTWRPRDISLRVLSTVSKTSLQKRLALDCPLDSLRKTRCHLVSSPPHSFAFSGPRAFFMMGSSLVAFIMSPLIYSLPDMNNRCAFALPATRSPKSLSDSSSVTWRGRPGSAA